MKIKIYTDGACRGNQNENANGGYGAVIIEGEQRTELSQGYADTTNNRMELRAVIAGLKVINKSSEIEVISDSKYVVDAFNQGWIEGWIKRGWKTAAKKPVKNLDLWNELLSLVDRHTITWNWVKGHAGHLENERADELACVAADSGELLEDTGATVVTLCVETKEADVEVRLLAPLDQSMIIDPTGTGAEITVEEALAKGIIRPVIMPVMVGYKVCGTAN